MSDRELSMDGTTPAREMLDALIAMGFTPETHPDLAKNMMLKFKEASAAAGFTLDEPITCRFTFTPDGDVSVTIRRA